ncbi:MAG: ester cyclase [Thermaceae bacterium]|nr:ester cyclase [Thermaceae bacterium]
MSAQENKVLARYYLERIFNHKSLAVIDEFYSPDVMDHSPLTGFALGLEGYRSQITLFLATFPDLVVEYQDFTCEADRVFSRYTLTATHQGEFAGIAATGKRVRVSGMDMLRFKEGKVVEHWSELDLFGLMQQLGASPA